MGPVLLLRSLGRRPAQRRLTWRRLALGGLVVGCLGLVLVPVIAYAPPLKYIRTMIGSNLERLADFGPYVVGLNAHGQFMVALVGTFKSFWATFGWMKLFFPDPVYQLLLAGTLLALVGLAWPRRGPAADRRPFRIQALAALLAIAVLIGWFVTSPNGVAYYQGRYLFGAIIPIAIVLVSGWLALVPLRFHGPAAVFIVVMMALFDAAALFTLAVPYYYPASLQ